jgi:hypothetical protein
MNRSLSGSIALTKLKHKIGKFTNKAGQELECIVIPIDLNHIVKGKEDACYLPVRVFVREEADEYGQHGFISQSAGSKKWKEANEQQREEFKNLPILGNIKDFDRSAADASGRLSEPIEPANDDKGDDLPF